MWKINPEQINTGAKTPEKKVETLKDEKKSPEIEKKHENLTLKKRILLEKRASKKEKDDAIDDLQSGTTSSQPWKSLSKLEKASSNSEIKEAEKEAIQALKEKHEAEIVEALRKFDFTTLDEETRKTIHVDVMSVNVNIEKVPKEIKDAALKWVKVNGKPVDMTEPLTDDQKEIIQKYAVKEMLEGRWKWKWTIGEIFWEDFTESPKLNLLLSEKAFFEEAKKDPSILKDTIEQIKTDGMTKSGIDPESTLWKKLTEIIRWNVAEYLETFKPEEGIIDIESFKGLKDVLGASYADLIYGDKQFILGEDHPLKKARDTILETLKDEDAQETIDLTPDWIKKYEERLGKKITDATGLDGGKEIQQINKIIRSWRKLSPFVKFLADLLAPFWALFPGEAGNFWRRYMAESGNAKEQEQNAYGKWNAQPVEWKGIENASASDIYKFASAEIGKNESSDPDLIREMHRYAGLGDWPGTPWCMSFVQYVLRKKMWFNSAQIWPPTAWAADGHSMGRHSDLTHAKPGDLVLIERSGGSGRHIGFFAGMNWNQVQVLWWNQSNAVNITSYNKSRVKEIRSLEIWEQIASNEGWKNPWAGGVEYPAKTAEEFLKQNWGNGEIPAWMRNNNPFNMKYTNSPFQRTNYVGMVWPSKNTDQWDPQIIFSSPEAGMYSGVVLVLHKYKNRWLNTVRKILADANGLTSDKTAGNALWNSAAEQIAKRMWVSPDQELVLSEPKTMQSFIRSYITQEHWSAWSLYNDTMIGAAVEKVI